MPLTRTQRRRRAERRAHEADDEARGALHVGTGHVAAYKPGELAGAPEAELRHIREEKKSTRAEPNDLGTE